MIALGCDHGGYDLMQEVMAHLDQRGIEYKNFGTFTKDSCDYPEYAKLVANAVVDGTCEKGILICGTGIGISIAANKVPGIRCALCHDCFSAKATREHNNANVLALPGRFINVSQAIVILRTWIAAEFMAGRHSERLQMIEKYKISRRCLDDKDPTYVFVAKSY